jgi:LigXa C-terminal domain like
MIPSGTLGNFVHVRAWVPVDDDHTMFWGMNLPRTQVAPGRQTTGRPDGAGSNGSSDAMGAGMLPDTSDWLGRFRLVQRAENDYLIDREAQRTNGNYTGIAGIHQQDQAVTESMGTIYGRNAEHLGTSDAMIIRTRRRIIRSAVALRTSGVIPPGVDNPLVYRARSGSIILPKGADWQSSTEHLRFPKIEAGMPAATSSV